MRNPGSLSTTNASGFRGGIPNGRETTKAKVPLTGVMQAAVSVLEEATQADDAA